MRISTQTLTAVIATRFLTYNTQNRKLDKSRVRKYATDMQSGNWTEDVNPICFDWHGNLINGQHRLHAIINANYTGDFLIADGVDPEARKNMDSGKIRTSADNLAMTYGLNGDDATSISLLCKLSMLYDLGLNIGSTNTVSYLTGTTQIQDYYNTNRAEIDNSLEYIKIHRKARGAILSKAELVFLHYIFSKVDIAHADIFIFKLITGVGLVLDDNLYILREMLYNAKSTNKSSWMSPPEKIYTAMRCFIKDRRNINYKSAHTMKYIAAGKGRDKIKMPYPVVK